MTTAISLQFLTEITHGDEKMIKDMTECIMKQIEEYLPILSTALNDGDYHCVLETAHKLKTSVKVMGDEDLYEKLAILQVNPSDPYISEMVVSGGYNLISALKKIL